MCPPLIFLDGCELACCVGDCPCGCGGIMVAGVVLTPEALFDEAVDRFVEERGAIMAPQSIN